MRDLIVILGDQLDASAAVLEHADPDLDAIWMCECRHESTKVWSHKARTAMFLAAMRHFAETLRERGFTVHYRALDHHAHTTLDAALAAELKALSPKRVRLTAPGEWDLAQSLPAAVAAAGLECVVVADTHFLCPLEDFNTWLGARKQPRMEHFYREMRRRTGWLMRDGEPLGGQWNYDSDNRESFGRDGPGGLPAPMRFEPDAITREVFATVETHFAQHPGSLDAFDWPVTRIQALAALEDFIRHRLADFGRYQDAIWAGEAWLYHSRLSAAINLKLLNPREVCEAAVAAHAAGQVPLASVEGFVRQILGWREYVRGLYWARMPDYREQNALEADTPLPGFYWTGDTDMACLRDTLAITLRHGYAHHIQRLMITGLFSLLLGVRPREINDWYLAIYVDAVEWVELPNVIGMSQWADGGFMASKPYIASGRYIERMSNHCGQCRFRPGEITGPRACPFTTLYWDFLDRHETRFSDHPRLKLQVRNISRKSDEEREAIRQQAAALRERMRSG
jgi:deoxyribodipyrimidine photolyase-related protein